MTNGVWDILGIEQTDSEREIKRAYAKKLKVTRPEDDPAGFQELHGAYKTALMMAKGGPYVPPQPAVPPPGRVEITYDDGQTVTLDNVDEMAPPAPPEPPEESLSKEDLALIDELMTWVDRMLAGPLVNVQVVNRWRFLTEPVQLLDDDFRVELGRRVIGAIVAFNDKPKSQHNRNYQTIGPHIITMLDDTFFWSSAPMLFVDPAEFHEILTVVAEVDHGLRQVTTKPVGGQIIESKNNKLREPKKETAGYQFSWWHVFFAVYLIPGLLRACTS